MRQISYADQQFVTSDAIADRVLRYAMLMGRAGTDDVVSLPAVGEDGSILQVEVLIGPASQITAVEVKGAEIEVPGEADVVAEIDRRMADLAPPSPVVADTPVEPSSSLDPDYL